MRIIAGQWRGRKLTSPPDDAVRPTTDRVREALFSMVAARLGGFAGLRVADIFSGSGALGLEALSRGAEHATFVDSARTSCRLVEQNAATLGATGRIQVLNRPATDLPPVDTPFDLIFMDPPYGKGLVLPTLARLIDRNWAGSGSLVVVETPRAEEIVDPAWSVLRSATYGGTRISLLLPMS
ncbi:16S rRNA (guanine(966)-N(2))-methyltransferase RsmD [Pedomonas sp. V897]|uniref:16S rRNA (guanine(966)-N(2))-methyltransferase RsmD n=1 Tax=Pedomonas sp. V897 TaxID=3446482 RepID=UPI003EE1C411